MGVTLVSISWFSASSEQTLYVTSVENTPSITCHCLFSVFTPAPNYTARHQKHIGVNKCLKFNEWQSVTLYFRVTELLEASSWLGLERYRYRVSVSSRYLQYRYRTDTKKSIVADSRLVRSWPLGCY